VHSIFMLLIDYQFHFLKVEWCFTFLIVNLHTRLLEVSKPGLEPRLRLLKSEARPKPIASPCQGPAQLRLERARLSRLRA
jgi:hypothetical protein